MEDNEFSVPPMSGEDQAPFREMAAEQPEPAPKPEDVSAPAKKPKLLLFSLGGAVVVIIILVAILIMVFMRSPETPPSPSPSPLPSPSLEATVSGLPKNIGERRDTLEGQLQKLDLQETDLSFPILDFELKF